MKDYVRTATLRGREMFVPLTHPAGEAQVDFGEALVVVAGVERKAHYLAMDLHPSEPEAGSPGTPACRTRMTAL